MLFSVIHNIPSPYRLHLFDAMWVALRARGWDFHVHFMSRGHRGRPLAWLGPNIEFPHTFWFDCGPRIRGIEWHVNPGLVARLIFGKPSECLLVGGIWSTGTSLLAARLARCRNAIGWFEPNTRTPGRLAGLSGVVKRGLLRSFDYLAVPGEDGRAYLQLLFGERGGAGAAAGVLLPNLVDERVFVPKPSHVPDKLVSLRAGLGLPAGHRVALCSARLAPVKGLVEFMRALSPELLRGWCLLILGDGPQREALAAKIEAGGFGGAIRLHPNVSYAQMPALYAIAELFVLPSLHDPNPLSVVEAMHSGLPLLLSSRVGNFPEALVEGVNGWGFDPANPQAAAAAARKAFGTSVEILRSMGIQSLRRADEYWNTERAIVRFLDDVGVRRATDH